LLPLLQEASFHSVKQTSSAGNARDCGGAAAEAVVVHTQKIFSSVC
jgi:hypothetical protein